MVGSVGAPVSSNPFIERSMFDSPSVSSGSFLMSETEESMNAVAHV